MTQFEAFLGTEFKAWAASETVTLKKVGDRVEIIQIVPDGRKARTILNLKNLQAYAIVE